MVKLSIKTICIIIFFWFLTDLLDLFVAENINDREFNKKPLPDIIHRNFPWWPRSELLPSILVAFISLYTIIRVSYININIVGLMFVSSIVLRILRIILYTSTITPSAMPQFFNHCKRHLLSHLGISFSQEKNTCIDNMFSGHAMPIIVSFIMIFLFSNNIYEKILMGILVLFATFIIISSRMHYTADVIVATTTSIGLVHLMKNIFQYYNINFD